MLPAARKMPALTASTEQRQPVDGLGAVHGEVEGPYQKLLEVAATAACVVDPEQTANEVKI